MGVCVLCVTGMCALCLRVYDYVCERERVCASVCV